MVDWIPDWCSGSRGIVASGNRAGIDPDVTETDGIGLKYTNAYIIKLTGYQNVAPSLEKRPRPRHIIHG